MNVNSCWLQKWVHGGLLGQLVQPFSLRRWQALSFFPVFEEFFLKVVVLVAEVAHVAGERDGIDQGAKDTKVQCQPCVDDQWASPSELFQVLLHHCAFPMISWYNIALQWLARIFSTSQLILIYQVPRRKAHIQSQSLPVQLLWNASCWSNCPKQWPILRSWDWVQELVNQNITLQVKFLNLNSPVWIIKSIKKIIIFCFVHYPDEYIFSKYFESEKPNLNHQTWTKPIL